MSYLLQRFLQSKSLGILMKNSQAFLRIFFFFQGVLQEFPTTFLQKSYKGYTEISHAIPPEIPGIFKLFFYGFFWSSSGVLFLLETVSLLVKNREICHKMFGLWWVRLFWWQIVTISQSYDTPKFFMRGG